MSVCIACGKRVHSPGQGGRLFQSGVSIFKKCTITITIVIVRFGACDIVPTAATTAKRIPTTVFTALWFLKGVFNKANGTALMIHLFHGICVEIA